MQLICRCRRAVLFTCLVAVCGAPECWAIAPPYQTDYELSQYPIIVIARWDKAAVTDHSRMEGNACRAREVFTELNVLRVLKGDLQTGRHRVMFGWGIGWQSDGTGLATWTSTHVPGDVDDLTLPSLWFLDQQRSWDASDTTEYLHLPHYRAIQPTVLEPYFRALLQTGRDRAVPQLLASADPLMVRRALRYICGEIWPWPYGDMGWDTLGYTYPEKRERLLNDAAPAVERVVNGPLEEVRPLAVAVYAELVQARARDRLRNLLKDQNASVRGVAVALLMRGRDAASLAAASDAVTGIDEGEIACKIIDELSAWKEPRGIPIVIKFLEDDHGGCDSGDDQWIVAVRARGVLHVLTGCWFPFRTGPALDAWAQVASIGDDRLRQQRLAELLHETEFPVVAELVGAPRLPPTATTQASQPSVSAGHVSALPSTIHPSDRLGTVQLRNASAYPVVIGKAPTGVEQEWQQGFSSYAAGPRYDTLWDSDFIELRPGEVLKLELALCRGFMQANPGEHVLKLEYAQLPPRRVDGRWIGVLPVRLGPLWDEQRPVEPFEERWSNGNLREKGQMAYGARFGEWHFFNIAGDRIRITDYSGGHGSTECDPEQPDNKGAGRRAPTTTQAGTAEGA